MKMHWHVATGLETYGPDGSDGFLTGLSLTETADLISTELDRAADSTRDLAVGLAAMEQWKEAWKANERSLELAHLSLNFSTSRKNAPLYAGDEPAWDEEVKRLIDRHAPVDIPEHSRLYVWECKEENCEHLEDSDA